jgi:hypothetical protein
MSVVWKRGAGWSWIFHAHTDSDDSDSSLHVACLSLVSFPFLGMSSPVFNPATVASTIVQ